MAKHMTKKVSLKVTESSTTNVEIGRTPGNWRETSSAAQCLSHLCLSEHLSDISFTFNDNESVRLPAHKIVLSMRSEVFEAMFYGSLAEGGETVLLKDVKPDVMKQVLRFIYSDKPGINGNNVLPCLYTAKKYQLSGLVKQCSDFLQNNIEESNVCQLYEQAVFYDMKDLQERCIVFITDNATSVLSSPGFLKLSHASLLNVLKRDELACDENDVFKAAMRWAEHKGGSKVGQDMRNQLGEAVFLIRFPTMPIEEFAQVVTPSGILTNEEVVMLFQFNATKGSMPLRKFNNQQRNGALITVHLPKNQQNFVNSCGCFLNIRGYNHSNGYQLFHPINYQVKSNSKSVKLKSVYGTFVGKVKQISTNQVTIPNYKINENKITFETPIDLSGNINVQFHFSDTSENCDQYGRYSQSQYVTYDSNIQESVKGKNITIVAYPEGLEKISLCCM